MTTYQKIVHKILCLYRFNTRFSQQREALRAEEALLRCVAMLAGYYGALMYFRAISFVANPLPWTCPAAADQSPSGLRIAKAAQSDDLSLGLGRG
jgi:hypothetical protein